MQLLNIWLSLQNAEVTNIWYKVGQLLDFQELNFVTWYQWQPIGHLLIRKNFHPILVWQSLLEWFMFHPIFFCCYLLLYTRFHMLYFTHFFNIYQFIGASLMFWYLIKTIVELLDHNTVNFFRCKQCERNQITIS